MHGFPVCIIVQLMKRLSQITTFLLLAVLLITGGACGRFTTSSVDEEKESHFLAGKNLLYSHDYAGAKVAFEKALQAIPTSAAAHLELGLLQYEQFKDHAEAIYHFERMLKYRPDHPVADRIKDQIQACKIALASEVTMPPANKRVEDEVKRLILENQGLTNLVSQLRGQIQKLKDSLARAPISGGSADQQASAQGAPRSGERRQSNSVTPRSAQRSNQANAAARGSAVHLKHVLKSGETFYSLARRYRLDFREIQRVNPGLKPTALKIGQVVNIPLSQTAAAQ